MRYKVTLHVDLDPGQITTIDELTALIERELQDIDADWEILSAIKDEPEPTDAEMQRQNPFAL